MKQSQQQLAILVALGAVMIVVYAQPFGRRTRSAARQVEAEAVSSPSATDAPRSSVPVSSEAAAQGRQAQREHEASLTWRRDPFTRSGSAAGVRGLTLSGILWDPQKPIAILNEQMVSVGDEVEDYQVLEIRPDRVLLTDGTETIQLLISQ